ncbi:ribosome small subunit-dependent GTPase A [Borrelia miyamotoi]|uniref:Small ribosomal subunit biogenesis GTPase RsgA n=1 Tax=Borrelia miyamotoi TaxID=47466 RepID=A0AAQ3AG86_9SPIR|nr:ribosome small subunit-dependent GTPase A [Borrelia miyamotoi]AGT27102.1 ribosome biogenesis GTPase RsgA [Borrelia miyamotoi LB-2001]AJA58306.1 ribosome biogenesis GTPase RsgA [Borrelia miyamotoi]AOW95384.1 ribosome small subunit-dependent GTPase A [Borrelia miyamotoi]QTL83263.1 ribosome small subunit-dependent GTPase A [Borrelia miyamotoi]WAZ85452.1 ribosome small subunit-dependent GTPase A [Borrelia miyamotoi]
MKDLKFEVLWGVNNIYSIVEVNTNLIYEGVIKGKILNIQDKEYSPLVPGDFIFGDVYDECKVYIKGRLERKNILWRYNKKADLRQVIVSNVDNIFIVSSANLPEIKNSFIDRILIVAEEQGITPIVLINKVDKGISDRVDTLIKIYENIGYRVIKTSAITFQGIEEIKEVIKNSRTSFVGQSGVGKSSLINLLDLSAAQAINEISYKYARGKHTTVYAMAFHSNNGIIIDTPGVKEFGIESLEHLNLRYCFKEFITLNDLCRFNSCLHTNEPSCFVVNQIGFKVSELRYNSYLKILSELKRYKSYAREILGKN